MKARRANMKTLVYGRDLLVKRVRDNLTGHGIDAVTVTSKPELETALSAYNKPDLVIIDQKVGDIAGVCGFSHDTWNACTVLMTGSALQDWRGLALLPVDGYVSDRFNNGELKARLVAIYRRVHPELKKVA
jgi:DNA-binding response OmpR family regulator